MAIMPLQRVADEAKITLFPGEKREFLGSNSPIGLPRNSLEYQRADGVGNR
jgi:hypothetical protein